MKKNDRKGFTLIEMLVVVAMIGALTVVLITSYKNVLPHVTATTGAVMEGKLNNAANEWMTLKIQSGEVDTRLEDLGNNLEEAIEALKAPINMDGILVNVGVPKKLAAKKVEGLGITYEKGIFNSKA